MRIDASLLRTPLALALVLCVSVMGTIWLQSNTEEEAVNILHSGSHTPEWFGRNIMSIKMNIQGTPHYQVWAQTLTHYSDNNTTDLVKPRFKQFPQTTKDNLWSLESEKGRIYHGEDLDDILRLDLWQNVYLSRPQATEQTPFEMTTSTVAIFPARSFATTDQPVVLKQPGHTLQGTGMELFLDTEEFRLLNDVRSMHVTQ